MSSDLGKDIDATSMLESILDDVRKDRTYLNYWNAYRRIQRLTLADIEVPEEKRVKIAVLSSFTVEPLVMYLDVDCRLLGLYPEMYLPPFNQYPQEILNDKSQLYRFSPNLIIIAVQAEPLLGEEFLAGFPKLSDEDKRKRQTEVIGYLEDLMSKLTSNTKSPILVNNFAIPWFSPFGILDTKVSLGMGDFFRELNAMIADLYRDSSQVYVFDLERLAGTHGKVRCTDYEMYYRGDVAFGESFLPVLADEYMSYIKALKNLTRKCIVLDLDNVLWGGILGEDGFDGIKLGEDPTGKAYVDFQRLLLAYSNRGVILALNSKNNHGDALRVIQEHPSMILRGRHFAAMRINWEDKVKNMIELADEMNIGLESMVFLDDSPHERERMRQALPQVLVPDLPESPFKYLAALQQLGDFNTLVLSEEDKRRAGMYYAKRRRRDLM
ncbi:MAG: HAD-IIIC family phosphatase, partial [Candidatus Bathyarchaeota archaeon]|nr:HAD-IIIC family phosphatase [Candidatus Bathyarchaeota archaeon]